MLAEAVRPLDARATRRLKKRLDDLAQRFDAGYLASDPLQFVHRYDDPADQEIVGLIAASLAYGNVRSVLRSVERVLAVLGPRPRAFIEAFDPARDRKRLAAIKHRFNNGRDLALLCHLIAQQVRAHGSLSALFHAGYDASHPHVGPALTHFVESILAGDARPFYPTGSVPAEATVRYLLTSPAGGSACKRMLLYLRWMIRPADGLDVGAWTGIPPSRLLVPLDTHVFRIGRYLGLVHRRTHDLRAAEEMTRALARLDPADPVRYDFALARLGILNLCPRRRDPAQCRGCDLLAVCRLEPAPGSARRRASS